LEGEHAEFETLVDPLFFRPTGDWQRSLPKAEYVSRIESIQYAM